MEDDFLFVKLYQALQYFFYYFRNKADVDIAVAAAKKAFERGSEYRKMDASVRGKILLK